MMLRRGFLALLTAALALPAAAQDTFQNVRRIVAIGDVHGDYEQFTSLLRASGLADASLRWTGGKTHLVQTGDVMDRGPDSRKIMDLLIALESQARKAGGRVHALLGNHEAMNLYGDQRYTTNAEYASYRKEDSQDLPGHPPGWADQRLAFEPEGTYGKWLRRHNTIIKINDILFLHGGISPKYASKSLKEINNGVRDELEDFNKLQDGMAIDPEGPLWYRGLAEQPESAAFEEQVNQVLQTLGARHVVVGHTPQPLILPRLGGKVIAIDVGMTKVFGGPAAALIVEDGKFSVLYRGQRMELPIGHGDVILYMKSAAALDPQPSRIDKLVEMKLKQIVGQ
jgi:hypothetical protein